MALTIVWVNFKMILQGLGKSIVWGCGGCVFWWFLSCACVQECQVVIDSDHFLVSVLSCIILMFVVVAWLLSSVFISSSKSLW